MREDMREGEGGTNSMVQVKVDSPDLTSGPQATIRDLR
jgi:hypothetical protein